VARWSLGVAAQGAALSIPEEARGRAVRVFRDCAGCPEMVELTGGAFLMGSAWFEVGRLDAEGPRRLVRVPPFAVGRYEVTFDEYDACVADGGCSQRPEDEGWGRGRRPVINVSWNEAQAYARWLSGKTGQRYRLLTEAEWEYAARAGTTTAFSWGPTASHEYANYGTDQCCSGLASGRDQWVNMAPVGQFPANNFGLHDMHGNVWEWVEDCFADNYSGLPTNGSASAILDCSRQVSRSRRVLRGGSWNSGPEDLRSAYRVGVHPAGRAGLGFRLARTL